jgi:hypothetical protein
MYFNSQYVPITGPLAMPWPHWEETGDSPWHQAMRLRWHKYIQYSFEKRMKCGKDVHKYFKHFVDLSNPLAEACCLTDKECDFAFWYGFHPDDQEELQPHLEFLTKDSWCPGDVPFENIFLIAYSVFLHPPPECLPRLRCPIVTSLPPQHFINLAEGDLQLHVNHGSLIRTQHSSYACKTLLAAPSPLHPTSIESVLLPAHPSFPHNVLPMPSHSVSAPTSLPTCSLSPYNTFSMLSYSHPLPPSVLRISQKWPSSALTQRYDEDYL